MCMFSVKRSRVQLQATKWEQDDKVTDSTRIRIHDVITSTCHTVGRSVTDAIVLLLPRWLRLFTMHCIKCIIYGWYKGIRSQTLWGSHHDESQSATMIRDLPIGLHHELWSAPNLKLGSNDTRYNHSSCEFQTLLTRYQPWHQWPRSSGVQYIQKFVSTWLENCT